MSLFEWMCESYNPGPTGGLGRHDNDRDRTRGGALLTGVLSLGLLGLPFALVPWQPDAAYIARSIGGILALEVGYLLAGYFLRPSPDSSNLGWCGGVVDNPFRISDDINRALLFLSIILIPGRLLAIGVVDLILVFRRA